MAEMTDGAFVALLDAVGCKARGEVDPDGLPVRKALLVAERAAMIADRCTVREATEWSLFAAAVGEAAAELQEGLDDGVLLPVTVRPDTAADPDRVRAETVALVRGLAELFAAAAAGGPTVATGNSPWRQLVWARVAPRLDTAAGYLR